MCSQTQSFRLQATLSSRGLLRWRTSIASAHGFSSCRSAHMNGVWIHMAATKTTMQIWRLVPVTQLLIYLFFFICAPPISRAPTASPAANRLSRGAWNVKSPSISVVNAAEDSPSLQPLNVRTAVAEKHTIHVVTALTARTHTCFKFGIGEADEGAVAQQDHMSALQLTPAAVTSECCSLIALLLERSL